MIFLLRTRAKLLWSRFEMSRPELERLDDNSMDNRSERYVERVSKRDDSNMAQVQTQKTVFCCLAFFSCCGK
jgi:hypothetical protein